MWRFSWAGQRAARLPDQISIHQMWRFSKLRIMLVFYIKHFNTSNVTVQPYCSEKVPEVVGISIHQMWRFSGRLFRYCSGINYLFQYIKCDGSAVTPTMARCVLVTISIHQMWRFSHGGVFKVDIYTLFQYIKCDGSAFSNPILNDEVLLISIHQMWRFSWGSKGNHIYIFWISIHQMWRFSPFVFYNIIRHLIFQYIKCDGSAQLAGHKSLDTTNFNTSNVTVQQYIVWLCLTFGRFQYIKCDGSANQPLLPSTALRHFNTSNVTVQHWAVRNRRTLPCYFNTSNVTVQRWDINWQHRYADISIHQMWRFSMFAAGWYVRNMRFQYIKCDGSATAAALDRNMYRRFQYIKCDGSACFIKPERNNLKNFNTSNVTVQPTERKKIGGIESISIHQMWRFSWDCY